MLTPYEPARAYLAAMRAVKWLGVIAIALIAIDMPGLALRLNMLLILAAAMFFDLWRPILKNCAKKYPHCPGGRRRIAAAGDFSRYQRHV